MRTLPDEMILDLCGINILEDVDFAELHRFKEYELDEIEINGDRVM